MSDAKSSDVKQPPASSGAASASAVDRLLAQWGVHRVTESAGPSATAHAVSFSSDAKYAPQSSSASASQSAAPVYASAHSGQSFAGLNARQILTRIARQRKWAPKRVRARLNELNDAVAADGAHAMGSLPALNRFLQIFDLPCDHTALSAARAAMKSRVFINIYDLLAGLYDRRCKSLAELRAYTIAKKLVYPLEAAKEEGLRDFLHHIFGHRRQQRAGDA